MTDSFLMPTADHSCCQWFLLALGIQEELSASTDIYCIYICTHVCGWVGGGGSPLLSSAIVGQFVIPVPPETFLMGRWYVSVIYCNFQLSEKEKQELFAKQQVAFHS